MVDNSSSPTGSVNLKVLTEDRENIASLYDILTDKGGGRRISALMPLTDRLASGKIKKTFVISTKITNRLIFLFIYSKLPFFIISMLNYKKLCLTFLTKGN
jgi:hypothetical protein